MIIEKNYALKDLNTFGLDIKAEHFARVTTQAELIELLSDANWKHTPKFILGGGSNLLLTQDVKGLVIQPAIMGIEVVEEDDKLVYLKVGAGECWHNFVMYCIKHNYAGVENLSLIPGSVGAAPMQNIGAYGVEIESVFESLTAIKIDDASTHEFSHSDCQFGYRNSVFKTSHKNQFIITHVCFRLHKVVEPKLGYGDLFEALLDDENPSLQNISNAVIKIRMSKLPDPTEIGNAGSFFKNPIVSMQIFTQLLNLYEDLPHYFLDDDTVKIPAAWLIEKCGWKGYLRGNIGVHDKQALVLVNHGGGSGLDIKTLSEEIQLSVIKKFNIKLVPEVNII